MLALNEITFNFESWKKLENEEYLNELIKKGKILESYQKKMIQIICRASIIKSQKFDDKIYNVAYVNTNLFKNEVGNKLVDNPGCDFSVVYNYDDAKNLTKFSLRSIDSKTDVSQISKIFGGGGHRNAAGYTKSGFHNSLI